MSNKPKIYAPCKAGCNWETVHKSDFDASASHIKQNIGEDGICYLEKGKEYKIFAPKNTSGNFTCSLRFAYLSNNVEKTFTITDTNADEYAESFVFRLLAATATTSQIKLVYEIAGVRYSETISGSSLALATENALYVSGATNVLLYNADATIVAKDGETPFIGENGNWWIGDIDTGVKAGGSGGGSVEVDAELSLESENPVQNKVITEALDGKVRYPVYSDFLDGISAVMLFTSRNNPKGFKMARSSPTAILQVTGSEYTFPMYKERTRSYAYSNERLENITNTIFIATPDENSSPFDAANKKYVDTCKPKKHTITVISGDTSFDIEFYSLKNNTDSVEYYDNEILDINANGIVSTPHIVLNGMVYDSALTISTSSLDHAIYQFTFRDMALEDITITSVSESVEV